MTVESLSPDYDAPETDYDQLRIPPQSVQAEQLVIGGLMLDNSTWDQLADRVGRRISTAASTSSSSA